MAHVASRSAWTEQEDELLRIAVHKYGDRAWALVSSQVPNRSSKSCSDRWRNFLSPNIAHPRKNPFTDWEVAVVVRGQQRFGNNWKAISMLLPGRTNRAVKNLFVGNLKCGARLNFAKNRYLGTGAELEDLIGEAPEGLDARALSAAAGASAASDDEGDASGVTSDDSGGSAWLNDDIDGPEATCASVLGARCRSPLVVKTEGAGGGGDGGSSCSPEPASPSHKRRRGNSPAGATAPSSPSTSPSSSRQGGGAPLARTPPGPSRLGRVSRRSSNSDTSAGRYQPYGRPSDATTSAGRCLPGVSGAAAAAAAAGGARLRVDAAGMRPSSTSDCFTFPEGSLSPVKRVVSPFEAAAHLGAPGDTGVSLLPGDVGLGVGGATSSSSGGGGRWRGVPTHPSSQGDGQPGQIMFDQERLRGAPSWTLPFQASLGGSATSAPAAAAVSAAAAAAAAGGAHSNAASSMGSLRVSNSLTLDGLEALDDAICGTTVTLTGDPLAGLMEAVPPVALAAVPSLDGLPSVPSLLTELGLCSAEPRLSPAEGGAEQLLHLADLHRPPAHPTSSPAAAAAGTTGREVVAGSSSSRLGGAAALPPSGNRRQRVVTQPITTATTPRSPPGPTRGAAGRAGGSRQQCKACGVAAAEAVTLRQQIARLQAEVAALQRENCSLRTALGATAAAGDSPTPSAAAAREGGRDATATPAAAIVAAPPLPPAAAAAVKSEPQLALEEPDSREPLQGTAAAAAAEVTPSEPAAVKQEGRVSVDTTPPSPTAAAAEAQNAAAGAASQAAAAAVSATTNNADNAAAVSGEVAQEEQPSTPAPAAESAAAAGDSLTLAGRGEQVGGLSPGLQQQEAGPAVQDPPRPSPPLHHHHQQQQQQQQAAALPMGASSAISSGGTAPPVPPPATSSSPGATTWVPPLPGLPPLFPPELGSLQPLPAPNRGPAAAGPPPLLAPPGTHLPAPRAPAAAGTGGVPLYPRVAAGGTLPSDIPPSLLARARVMAARSALQQQQQM